MYTGININCYLIAQDKLIPSSGKFDCQVGNVPF